MRKSLAVSIRVALGIVIAIVTFHFGLMVVHYVFNPLHRPARYLIKQLHDHDGSARREAAEALWFQALTKSLDARVVAPALIEATKDDDRDVRRRAVDALGEIGAMPGTIQALIAALDDTDQTVRFRAIVALGHIGPDAVEAAPALSNLLRDPDKAVRDEAASALREVKPYRLEAK